MTPHYVSCYCYCYYLKFHIQTNKFNNNYIIYLNFRLQEQHDTTKRNATIIIIVSVLTSILLLCVVLGIAVYLWKTKGMCFKKPSREGNMMKYLSFLISLIWFELIWTYFYCNIKYRDWTQVQKLRLPSPLRISLSSIPTRKILKKTDARLKL